MSRQGTDLTNVFPDLATSLAEQVPDGTLLDAEIVALQDGRLSFDALQHRMAGTAKQASRRTRPPSLRRWWSATCCSTKEKMSAR